MAFALIRPTSREWTGDVPTDEDAVARADRVALLLRADYERWSRWAFGLLAFAATALGVFIVGGMLDAIAALGSAATVDVVLIAVSALIAIAGAAALLRLWQTGRVLTRAATGWLRLPYRAGGRTRRAGGWVLTRTANLDPPIFARLITATLALLLAIGGIALAARDLAGASFTGLSAAAGVIGIVALACGLGQAGGVIRIVSGVSEGDPLWSRIRSGLARR
ncbi:hypothetical protein [Microbacterium timonense]|uniref:hypothetical protein n=1 Tax=Microbacterium timonense TaxID=2086576 RepID=UPI000D0FD5E5|nr:hypothetical protein [Microbacterium timonense]